MFSIMNPSIGKKYNLPKITTGKYGDLSRKENFSINNHYDTWLFEYISFLFEDNQEKRPIAATDLGFFERIINHS